MPVFAVSFYRSGGQSFQELTERLAELGGVRVHDSLWLVVSVEQQPNLLHSLQQNVGASDCLVVMTLDQKPAFSLLPEALKPWFEEVYE